VLSDLRQPLRVVLNNPALASLLAAFGGLTFAEWGYVTALAIHAFRVDGSFAVGLVGLRLLVGAVASITSGGFVERHGGRQLLSAIAGLRAAVVFASAGLAASGAPLAPLVVLVMVDAVVAALYRPAQAARLAAAARTPTELAASAAGLSTVKTLSQAVGAAAGGALLAVTSPATVFVAAGVLFAMVAATTVQTTAGRPSAGRRTRAAASARVTARVISGNHVGGIIVVSGLRSLVRGMWVALVVIASIRLLHAGSAGVGLLMLAAGVGAVTAVPLSTSLINRSNIGTPTAVALFACGAPLAVVAGAPFLEVAVFLVVAWGVGMAVADVGASALLFRLLDTPQLPRVIGVIESAKLALEGCGAFLAPVLASAFGARAALVIAAAPLPIVVAAGLRMLHRVDAMANERHRVLALLHGVPCLEPLDVVSIEYLAARAEPVEVAPGCDVVRQGAPVTASMWSSTGPRTCSLTGTPLGRSGRPGVSARRRSCETSPARPPSARRRRCTCSRSRGRTSSPCSMTGAPARSPSPRCAPARHGNGPTCWRGWGCSRTSTRRPSPCSPMPAWSTSGRRGPPSCGRATKATGSTSCSTGGPSCRREVSRSPSSTRATSSVRSRSSTTCPAALTSPPRPT